jgi:hypothetical protein
MSIHWNEEILLFAVVALVVAFDGVKRAIHWLQDRHRERGLPRHLCAALYRLGVLDPSLAAPPTPAASPAGPVPR